MEIPAPFLCDFHVHTSISACALRDEARAHHRAGPTRRGYRGLGLSDHAHPETIDRILALRGRVDSLKTSIEVYLGCEVDVIAHPLRGLQGGPRGGALFNQVEQGRLERLLDQFHAAGFALELTDSRQKAGTAQDGYRRFYQAAARRSFPFSLGSDAHGLDDLGQQCEALWLYRDLGLSESCMWRPGC